MRAHHDFRGSKTTDMVRKKSCVLASIFFLTNAQWGKKFHEIKFVWPDNSQTRKRVPYGAHYAQPSVLAVWELVGVVWKGTTIDCGCSKMLNHGLNHVFFSFTFQAYTLPHTLNCMCVSLFKFHIWILK